MELFNDSVIPVGSSHLTLIRLMLYISASFLFAYSGLLFGSLVLSISAARKAKSRNDYRFQKLAQDLIHVSTGIPAMWFGLGLVPLFSFLLGYPQLLHGTEGDVVGYIIITLFLYIMAFASAYVYKNAINFKSVFFTFKTNIRSNSAESIDEFHTMDEDTENTGTFASIWGVVILFLAIWFLAGSTTYAYDSSLWGESIFAMVFSWNTAFKALLIMTMGIAFASSVYLFMAFSWQGGTKFIDHEHKDMSKNFVRSFGLYSTLIIPLIYAFEVVTIPADALSGWMFVFALLSLLLVVFFAQSLYLTKKVDHIKGIKYGFMYIMIAFAMFAAQDQQAFHISIAENLHSIAEVANIEKEEREAKYTSEDAQPQIDAQAIFETRCIACHKFDAKMVGPAYNDVIPKYEGKEAELVKFILNPTPVNPGEYPAGMPNQGLSAAEGKAMAKWLMDKVLGGGDAKEAAPKEEEKKEENEEPATAATE